MTFSSILYERIEDHIKTEALEEPPFFPDLNLDQVINAMTENKKEYNLKPFFYATLHDAETIHYRHEVERDLENEALMAHIQDFAAKMIIVRRYLALVEKLNFDYHKKGWHLEAALAYCNAVNDLRKNLSLANLKSRGLIGFQKYVMNYVKSDEFQVLLTDTEKLKADLSEIKYCVIIKNSTVKVRKYEEETDYSAEVESTFGKFQQGTTKDYRVSLHRGSGMNHIEAQILGCVSRLFPDIFANLDDFYEHHSTFVDDTILTFDREIQFYVAYFEFIAGLKRAGLNFCYPQISTTKEIYGYDGFDIALAKKLVAAHDPVVCNDFFLEGEERVLVVSGPNQGGKTTFARTFGQLHYLANIGCPVPGRNARIPLFDRMFTHFETEEDITNLRGKLQDDLVRIHSALEQSTPNSIVIMNEIFSSTTLRDAIFLSNQIMERILTLDILCVWVTFVDELASFSENTVSMVSTVVPENPACRTFKIVRKPADGLAYALSIAEKHRVTYQQIKERIKA